MIPFSLVALLAAATMAAQATAPAHSEDPRPEKRIGARGETPGTLVFEAPAVASFEDVHQGAVLEQRFAFRNGGQRAVRIEQGIALVDAGTVEFEPALVPPGGRGEVRVRQPVGDRLGRADFRFAVVTDEPGVSRYRLGLSGFVESAYDPEAPLLDWKTADKGAAVTVEAELFSREVEALRVLGVADAPSFLRVDTSERAGLNGEGVRIRATLDTAHAPLGITHGVFRLRTNVPDQPECAVSFHMRVVGDVAPSSDTLNLGLIRLGEEASGEVTLTSRSGRAVEVSSVESPDVPVTTAVVPCAGDKAGPSCRVLRVTYRPAQRGHFAGTIAMRVAGLDAPLRIVVSGLVVSPQTRIKEIDIPQGADAEPVLMSTQPPAASAVPSPPLSNPAPSPPPPSSDPAKVTLAWKARNESAVYGYLVYRSEKPSGPFLRANRKIIRAAGGDGEIRSYAFVDHAVGPDRTYYYYLDVVETSGLKKRLTEVKARQAGSAR